MIEAQNPVFAGLLGDSPCRDLSPEDRAIMLEQRVQEALNDQAGAPDLEREAREAEQRADSAENELESLEVDVRAYKQLLVACNRRLDGEITDSQFADAVRACENVVS